MVVRLSAPLSHHETADDYAKVAAQLSERLRVVVCKDKGHPCKLKSETGKRRCKFHGGKSTGPRTAEGRERIAEAQRARWTKYRAQGNFE